MTRLLGDPSHHMKQLNSQKNKLTNIMRLELNNNEVDTLPDYRPESKDSQLQTVHPNYRTMGVSSPV